MSGHSHTNGPGPPLSTAAQQQHHAHQFQQLQLQQQIAAAAAAASSHHYPNQQQQYDFLNALAMNNAFNNLAQPFMMTPTGVGGSQVQDAVATAAMMNAMQQFGGLISPTAAMTLPSPTAVTPSSATASQSMPSTSTTAGMKHSLPPSSPASDEQPASKRQKLDLNTMPPLQTASGAAVTSQPATSNNDLTVPSGVTAAPATAPVAPSTSSGPSDMISNGGKSRSTDVLSSPTSASPGPGATDAYGGWSNSATGSATAPSHAGAPLNPEIIEQGVATTAAHIAKLNAWIQSEQEELNFLRSILTPSDPSVPSPSYLDYQKPFTGAFSAIDAATPLPSFAAPAATGGSRLSRAAGAHTAHVNEVAPGPSLEELEARRAVLANKIKLFQADSGRKLDASLEPPRNKTHWDYVLAEMEWMAGDFVRERKWKINMAKKVGRSILNHHKKEVGKEYKQLRDEVIQRRKRAAWVSREIKKFWANIGKLVKHKHQTIVEEEKKKQMDRHLEILVDQTETFSGKLAADLASKGVGQHAKATPNTSGTPSASPVAAAAAASSSSASPSDDDEESTNTDGVEVGRVDDILQNLKGPGPVDPSRRSTRVIHKPAPAPSASGAATAASSATPGAAAASNAPKEETAAEIAADENFGEDESEEDEEDTISEAEEAEAAESGGASSKVKDEVKALEAEAEMSIEELRKLYGADQEEEEVEDGGSATGVDEDEEMADNESAAASASSMTPMNSSTTASPAFASDDGGGEDEEGVEVDENSDVEEGDDMQQQQQGEEQKSNTTMLIEKAGAVTEEQRMTVASNLAATAQPKGYTLDQVTVKTKIPSILKGPGPLREYQHIGLDWLVTMYENGLNGILADEMGLGKTIMCISLLAHLAIERQVWGQHLIVVPTSVIVNWEMEFKRWLPGFKILCYHGSAKDRKWKRRGWSDPNAFHVCITSYQLVIQDARIFRRKRWHYLILDEAHNIKNFKSQRWQTLLNFRTYRRLLLTGTPLQNSVTELWSLMHFLMPQVFQSQTEFKTWFSNPVSAMVEGKDAMNSKLLNRLHGILRPFLLRRLKTNVAQQLPQKFEHVLYCKLSKRQRYLYEDFMSLSDTQKTLASGNFMGMMNVVMSLRKVCNHPDLFSGRAIVSPFDQADPIEMLTPSPVLHICDTNREEAGMFQLDPESREMVLMAHLLRGTSREEAALVSQLRTPKELFDTIRKEQFEDPFDATRDPYQQSLHFADPELDAKERIKDSLRDKLNRQYPIDPIASAYLNTFRQQRNNWRVSRRSHLAALNAIRTDKNNFSPYPTWLLRRVHIDLKHPHNIRDQTGYIDQSQLRQVKLMIPIPRNEKAISSQDTSLMFVRSYEQRAIDAEEVIKRVCCIIPKARAKAPQLWMLKPHIKRLAAAEIDQLHLYRALSPAQTIFRSSFARQQLFFPDKYLLQWDCGKLQKLAWLLRERKEGGHRVLIFSQFSKMLDILEAFLSMHGYKYLRLDGSTKVDERQRLMEKFNRSNKYFVFILSTRSGGVGINLVGADSVVMYDSDWNPAADLQAQDRAHRIGQTKEVNIFRLISERTIEENILKKSNQKREMNNVVIGDGNFSTDFLAKLDPRELLGLPTLKDDAAAKAQSKSGVIIEEMKDGADATDNVTVKKEAYQSPAELAELERQRLEAMASLEDEVDRVALENVMTEVQVDQDDFSAGDDQAPDKVKARAEAAKPSKSTTAIKSMGKVGAAARGQQSTSHIPAVAAFENALTPVQRYALRFSEFIDPLISAQQMRAEQKQREIEDAKWKSKQGGTAPKAAFPVGDSAMDTSDSNQPMKSIKTEDAPAGATPHQSNGDPSVKKEPADSPSNSSLHPLSPSHAQSSPRHNNNNTHNNSHPNNSSSSAHPSSSSNPGTSSTTTTGDSKNVLAGSRQSLEDRYFHDQFRVRHLSFYQQYYQPQSQYEHLPITYEYPFMQPEYNWQVQQQQHQIHQQQQAQQAALKENPNATVTPIVPPKLTSIGFGSLPFHTLVNHPYLNSSQRRSWQYRNYRQALQTLASRAPYREARPFRDAPSSPRDDDVVVASSEPDAEYGLFSTPDAISRMLGPKLHHPERTPVQQQSSSHPSHPQQRRPDVKSHHRRLVGVEGEVRIAYVSPDESDPVSIRIPWLKLKSGGIDRSFLVLSRAGVDYPAKTNQNRQQQGGATASNNNTNVSQEEQARMKKMRIAYEGLQLDERAQPFQSAIQMRPLAPNSILLAPPKRIAPSPPPPNAAATKPGSTLIAINAAATRPSLDSTRDGLFAGPILGVLRPRPAQVEETMPRDRILNWSPDEDATLTQLVNDYGSNWGLIAQILQATPRLAGRARSPREVANRHYYLTIKRSGGELPASIVNPPQPKLPPGAPPAAEAADADDGKSSKKRTKDGKLKDGKDKKLDPKKHAAPEPPVVAPKKKGALAPGMSAGWGTKLLVMCVDRATKQIKTDHATARYALRQAFQVPPPPPQSDDPTQPKVPVKVPEHPSQKQVVHDAHIKLGLPPQAMGKTLMPHQIIQLRIRREQARREEEKRRMMQNGPNRGNYPPNSNMPPNMSGGSGGPPNSNPNMGPPSNQRMSSTPNMSSGGGPSGSNMNRSGPPMSGGPGGPGGPPYHSSSGSSRGPPGPNNGPPMNNNGPPGSYPNSSSSAGGNYNNNGGVGGNYPPVNSNSSSGGNYNSSSSSSSSNYPNNNSGPGGNNSGAPPPMQRYSTAPSGGTSGVGSRSNNPSGGGNPPMMNSGGSGAPYNPNTGGTPPNNPPYNPSSSSGQRGTSGSGGNNSNYYPGNNSMPGGGGGNSTGYAPSISPPPMQQGGGPNLLPPNSSGAGGGGGNVPGPSSSRAKSPASLNTNYTGGNYPNNNTGTNSGGGLVTNNSNPNLNVLMNSSGAPAPNIPPANSNYYGGSNNSGGGGTPGGSSGYNNYSGGNSNSGGGGNINTGYSNTNSNSSYPPPSNRGTSGGGSSSNYPTNTGSTGYSNTSTSGYPSSSTTPSKGSIGTGQQTTDEEALNQLLAFVSLQMPMLSKSAIDIFNRTNLSAKQRFNSITTLLSKTTSSSFGPA